jgi:hypothetical protein
MNYDDLEIENYRIKQRIEALEKKLQELEDFNTPAEQKLELLRKQIDKVDKRLEELETKTASDFSQEVISKTETNEEQDCAWVARDEGGLFAFSEEPEFFRGEWSSDSDYHKLPANLFPQVTFENSPQKLVLAPVVAESETSEEGYVPTVDDFFYNPEEENSEKPNNQEFDKERALELLQDIESSSTKNSNASTKAILLSCAELREMLGGE